MVKKVIMNVDLSKAPGLECIPVGDLRNCEPELSYILPELFNKCLKESCFPDCWKVSLVVPVFKIFFLNWDSLHARLNSHYEAWSYKKNKHKKTAAYRKSVWKEPTVKRCLLILALKPLRSYIKGKHSIGREFQSLTVWAKKLLT